MHLFSATPAVSGVLQYWCNILVVLLVLLWFVGIATSTADPLLHFVCIGVLIPIIMLLHPVLPLFVAPESIVTMFRVGTDGDTDVVVVLMLVSFLRRPAPVVTVGGTGRLADPADGACELRAVGGKVPARVRVFSRGTDGRLVPVAEGTLADRRAIPVAQGALAYGRLEHLAATSRMRTGPGLVHGLALAEVRLPPSLPVPHDAEAHDGEQCQHAANSNPDDLA